MIKRSFVLDTKVANLSRTSASQSIYSDTCRQPPFLCQNPIYPHISSSSNFVSPKKKRIFIRFSLLCSFLIKDSSADSITCCLSLLAVKKLQRFRLGRHTNWISDGNWRCHFFYTVRPQQRVEKVPQVFSSVRYISSQSKLLETERTTKLYVGWLGGLMRWIYLLLYLKAFRKVRNPRSSACIIGALMLKFALKSYVGVFHSAWGF